MPEISGLLILILIFGFNFLRKKALQSAEREEGQQNSGQRQQTAMPGFPEAAPALPVRHVSTSKITSISKKIVNEPNVIPAEGDSTMWQAEKQASPPPTPVTVVKPGIKVLPLLTRDSLVQGVVLREILTRPKHAVGAYLTNYPPRV